MVIGGSGSSGGEVACGGEEDDMRSTEEKRPEEGRKEDRPAVQGLSTLATSTVSPFPCQGFCCGQSHDTAYGDHLGMQEYS